MNLINKFHIRLASTVSYISETILVFRINGVELECSKFIPSLTWEGMNFTKDQDSLVNN